MIEHGKLRLTSPDRSADGKGKQHQHDADIPGGQPSRRKSHGQVTCSRNPGLTRLEPSAATISPQVRG